MSDAPHEQPTPKDLPMPDDLPKLPDEDLNVDVAENTDAIPDDNRSDVSAADFADVVVGSTEINVGQHVQQAADMPETELQAGLSPPVDDVMEANSEQVAAQHDAAQQYRTHMEELWNLRPAYTRLAKSKFQLEVKHEETTAEQQRALKKSLQAGVEIADELRRLVHAAQNDQPLGELPAPNLFRRLLGRNSPPDDSNGDSPEWLDAFQRLWQLAVNRLESTGVYFVQLLGKDLQSEEFEGHSIKRMVSVKNKPDGEALVVKQEICGLWIFKSKQQLLVIQRGEVLV